MPTYKIVRMFFNGKHNYTIKDGLTLAQAKAHCKDPETSSKTCTSEEGQELTRKYGKWFDAYSEE